MKLEPPATRCATSDPRYAALIVAVAMHTQPSPKRVATVSFRFQCICKLRIKARGKNMTERLISKILVIQEVSVVVMMTYSAD